MAYHEGQALEITLVKKLGRAQIYNIRESSNVYDEYKQEPILAIRCARNAFSNRRNGPTDGPTDGRTDGHTLL